MRIHVVRQGDTLLDLTQKYNVPLERILEVNPDVSEGADILSKGTKIRIPTGKISLQRNNSSNTESKSDNSEPIFKEPSPQLVDATPETTGPVYAEQEPSDDPTTENTVEYSPKNVGNYSQSQSVPKPNEYGYDMWPYSYYGNYYPAVSYYPNPEFVQQSYYPVSHIPPYASSYYQGGSLAPVGYTNAYYPDQIGYASVDYSNCIPCAPCQEGHPQYVHSYSEKPWKR